MKRNAVPVLVVNVDLSIVGSGGFAVVDMNLVTRHLCCAEQ